MQTILDNRPKGVPMDDVIKAYTANGYKVEGINYEKPKPTVLDTVKDYATEAVTNPVETAKGVIKGIPGQAAGLVKLAEMPGKFVTGKIAEVTGMQAPQGFDFAPIEELTAPSNKAQEVGYLASGFLPVGGATGAIKTGTVKGAEVLSKGVKPVVEVTKKGINLAKEGINPTLSAEKAIGQVAQGKAGTEKVVAKGLGAIDTKGVKTYKDLNVKLEEAIPNLSQQVDQELLKDPVARNIAEYTTKLKTASGDPVEVNYVQNALKDLKELYDSTGDVVKSKEIENLLNYGDDLQLDRKTVNDISRKYGEEFSTKAFSKVTGEPLTSVNAQKFENTRKGLKDVARQGLGGKEAQALDDKLSSIYNTQKLIAKQEEAVNKLKNKIEERGWLSKATYTAIKTLDTLSGGVIRGATDAVLSRGQGLKTLNALDLEKNLEKNLNIIRKASEAQTEAEAQKILKSLESFKEGAVPKTAKKSSFKMPSSLPGFVKVGKVKDVSNVIPSESILAPDVLNEAKELAKNIDKAYYTPKNIEINHPDLIEQMKDMGLIDTDGVIKTSTDKANFKLALSTLLRRNKTAEGIANTADKAKEIAKTKASKTGQMVDERLREDNGRFK